MKHILERNVKLTEAITNNIRDYFYGHQHKVRWYGKDSASFEPHVSHQQDGIYLVLIFGIPMYIGESEVNVKQIIPLCHSCHNFIHSGRLSITAERDKIIDILKHGFKILEDNHSDVSEIFCFDSDYHAIEACKRNLDVNHKDRNYSVIWADLTQECSVNLLSFIVMNPPFHEGKGHPRLHAFRLHQPDLRRS